MPGQPWIAGRARNDEARVQSSHDAQVRRDDEAQGKVLRLVGTCSEGEIGVTTAARTAMCSSRNGAPASVRAGFPRPSCRAPGTLRGRVGMSYMRARAAWKGRST